MTASEPGRIFRSRDSSRRSPLISSRWERFLTPSHNLSPKIKRSRPRTWYPCSKSRGTRTAPTYPPPPVTRTRRTLPFRLFIRWFTGGPQRATNRHRTIRQKVGQGHVGHFHLPVILRAHIKVDFTPTPKQIV